jgi:hypothetical protein
VGIVGVVQLRSDLLKVVLALDAVGGFPNLLNGRQQQTNQGAEDGDDHQQFDQREGVPAGRRAHKPRTPYEGEESEAHPEPMRGRVSPVCRSESASGEVTVKEGSDTFVSFYMYMKDAPKIATTSSNGKAACRQ